MAPRLEDLLDDALALEDPIDRFRALDVIEDRPRELHARIRYGRIACVQALREGPEGIRSWNAIGVLLGISGERARQLGREIEPRNPNRAHRPDQKKEPVT